MSTPYNRGNPAPPWTLAQPQPAPTAAPSAAPSLVPNCAECGRHHGACLYRHKVQTGLVRFVCSICDKDFGENSSNAHLHMKGHGVESPCVYHIDSGECSLRVSRPPKQRAASPRAEGKGKGKAKGKDNAEATAKAKCRVKDKAGRKAAAVKAKGRATKDREAARRERIKSARRRPSLAPVTLPPPPPLQPLTVPSPPSTPPLTSAPSTPLSPPALHLPSLTLDPSPDLLRDDRDSSLSGSWTPPGSPCSDGRGLACVSPASFSFNSFEPALSSSADEWSPSSDATAHFHFDDTTLSHSLDKPLTVHIPAYTIELMLG